MENILCYGNRAGLPDHPMTVKKLFLRSLVAKVAGVQGLCDLLPLQTLTAFVAVVFFEKHGNGDGGSSTGFHGIFSFRFGFQIWVYRDV